MNENKKDNKITHDKMVKWYDENKEVKDFILEFFKLKRKDGIRTRAIHDMRSGKKPVIYCHGDYKCLTDINEKNWDYQIKIPGVMHFREEIFDERVRMIESYRGIKVEGWENEPYRIGCSICFDIDAPSHTVNGKVNGKVNGMNGSFVGEEVKEDFLDKDKWVFDDFNKGKEIVEKEVEEMGSDYNCISSCNGVYVILESEYPEEFEEMGLDPENSKDSYKINYYWGVKYAGHVRKTIDDINLILEEKGVKCHIDNRWRAWSLYHKAPFTYHGNFDRISIPISKGEMDWDFMKRNMMISSIDAREVIRESKWRNRIW